MNPPQSQTRCQTSARAAASPSLGWAGARAPGQRLCVLCVPEQSPVQPPVLLWPRSCCCRVGSADSRTVLPSPGTFLAVSTAGIQMGFLSFTQSARARLGVEGLANLCSHQAGLGGFGGVWVLQGAFPWSCRPSCESGWVSHNSSEWFQGCFQSSGNTNPVQLF